MGTFTTFVLFGMATLVYPARCMVKACDRVGLTFGNTGRLALARAVAAHGVGSNRVLQCMVAHADAQSCAVVLYRFVLCRLVGELVALLYSDRVKSRGKDETREAAHQAGAALCNEYDGRACAAYSSVHASMFESAEAHFACNKHLACARGVIDRMHNACIERSFHK